MFETVKTIIAILREKEPPAEKIVLSLDDLCPIWIKYNSSFKPAAVVKETAKAASGPEETALSSPPSEDAGAAGDRSTSGKAVMTAQAFYGEVIEPHKEALAGMLEGINRIMELLERYGDCPSVVDTIADSEKKVATRVGDILSKVTLRDHTFNVVRIALRLLKDTYHDPVGYVPAVIIAALGHDLGKIPELRSQGQVREGGPPSDERLHRRGDIRERQRCSLAQDGR